MRLEGKQRPDAIPARAVHDRRQCVGLEGFGEPARVLGVDPGSTGDRYEDVVHPQLPHAVRLTTEILGLGLGASVDYGAVAVLGGPFELLEGRLSPDEHVGKRRPCPRNVDPRGRADRPRQLGFEQRTPAHPTVVGAGAPQSTAVGVGARPALPYRSAVGGHERHLAFVDHLGLEPANALRILVDVNRHPVLGAVVPAEGGHRAIPPLRVDELH